MVASRLIGSDDELDRRTTEGANKCQQNGTNGVIGVKSAEKWRNSALMASLDGTARLGARLHFGTSMGRIYWSSSGVHRLMTAVKKVIAGLAN